MQIGKTAVNLGLALLTFAGAAFAVGAPGIIAPAAADNEMGRPNPEDLPLLQPGQALVRLAPGANANAIAAHYGIQVGRRLRFAPNTVVFTGIQADLEQAIASLNATPGVIAAQPNYIFRTHGLPRVRANDEFLGKQWALPLMNGVSSWGITVGQRLESGPLEDVVVGVIDAGFSLTHPDLAANMHPDAYDFILDAPYDESKIPSLRFISHGTGVSGCVAAVTNNGRGVSSLPFESVKVLACEVGIGGFGIDIAAATDAVYYSVQKGAAVINMSFGAPAFFAPFVPVFNQAVRDAYNSGVVITASTGNGRSFGVTAGVNHPALLPEVIPVGAVGPLNKLSFFSDGGPELRDNGIVAPGGDAGSFFDTDRQVLVPSVVTSRFRTGAPDGYEYTQGTSFSSPYAAGLIATLLTQGARDEEVTGAAHVERIRDLLRSTARSPAGGPNDEFGAGLVNLEAALREVTQVIELDVPEIGEVTASVIEPIEVRLSLPSGDDIDEDQYEIFVNGADVTDESELVSRSSGMVVYEPDEDSEYQKGRNTFNVRFTDPENPDRVRSLQGPGRALVPATAATFRVQPHQETPGVRMISIPYKLRGDGAEPEILFRGQLRRLARWLPGQQRYAIWDPLGAPQDQAAELLSESAGVPKPPIGLGFWARIDDAVELRVLGQRDRSAFYPIPLEPGFNLIGNPYPYRIPWSFVSVRFGNELLSITEAVQRRVVSSSIWRYLDGRYNLSVLPGGELVPWEAHWVRNTSGRAVTLMVPNAGALSLQQSGTLAPGALSSNSGVGPGAAAPQPTVLGHQNPGGSMLSRMARTGLFHALPRSSRAAASETRRSPQA